jgi:hypothetical protein
MKLLNACVIGIIILVYGASPLEAAVRDLADRYIALAIQGDLPAAKRLLDGAAADEPTAEAVDLLAQFDSRFVDRDEAAMTSSGSEFIDRLVALYREYWSQVMTGSLSVDEGDTRLETALAELVGAAGQPQGEDVYDSLGRKIREAGFHSFNSTAPPYQELFLWRSQRTRMYRVELTDTSRPVRVEFMDDFLSLGWKHFATLGLASTTGWVEDGVLYCVDWAYDPDSENFEVSYLKHEARHLVDLELYPGLSSTELEYRAKLTELAYAWRSAGRLLDDFTAKSANNPDSPHAEANFRVTRDLYAELYGTELPAGKLNPWGEASRSRINRAARALLVRDTGLLQISESP